VRRSRGLLGRRDARLRIDRGGEADRVSTAAPPAERSHRVTTADGVELQAWLASPPNPRGVLLLCHGLTTDATEHGAFPALRNHAVKRGLAVARFDFRAHGRSGGSNEDLRLAGERADADAVVGLIEAELGRNVPLISLGLSFGGAAAIHTAATAPSSAGLVLWYAVVDYEWNFGDASTVDATRLFRAAARPGEDPAWAAMPVLGTDYYFPKALLEEIGTDTSPAQLRGLEIPVLGYYGSRDRFVDVGPLRKLAAERANINVRIAWGAGHGFLLWRPWAIRRTVTWALQAASGSR
jgi:pimeloyl-ACP methyl ester carboxylesterase